MKKNQRRGRHPLKKRRHAMKKRTQSLWLQCKRNLLKKLQRNPLTRKWNPLKKRKLKLLQLNRSSRVHWKYWIIFCRMWIHPGGWSAV